MKRDGTFNAGCNWCLARTIFDYRERVYLQRKFNRVLNGVDAVTRRYGLGVSRRYRAAIRDRFWGILWGTGSERGGRCRLST